MTVNLGLRRIASLSAFLLAMGVCSATQAGIIPWAYDVIFGPVRYPSYGYGYSPYAVSYSRPVYVRSAPMYAPAGYGYSSGCSSCSSYSYAPVNYGCAPPIAASSCGPCGAIAYAPAGGCLSGCAPSPAAASSSNGKAAWNSTKKPGEPGPEPAPTPRTFQNLDRGASPAGATSDDGLGNGLRSRGTRTSEGTGTEIEANRPASSIDEPTILKPKKAPTKTTDDFDLDPQATPAKPVEKKFEKPLENNDPSKEANDGTAETTIRRSPPKLNLDDKIAWHPAPPMSRVPIHAKLAKACVTRRLPGVDSDWTPVVAKSTGTQLVRK